MIKYKMVSKRIKEKQWIEFICDKCKTVIKNSEENIFAIQEAHTFSGTGGYGSHFGDCYKWEINLCDKCCYEMFKPYLHYEGETNCWGNDIKGKNK